MLRVGCYKTTFVVTKVTYNMYLCDTCCMSREMMEMDGRDSVMCQKSRRRDIDVILEFVNNNRTKRNSCLLQLKRSQKPKTCRGDAVG